MSRPAFSIMTCFLFLLMLAISSSVSAQVTFVGKWGSQGDAGDEFTNAAHISLDGNGDVCVVDASLNTFKNSVTPVLFCLTGASRAPIPAVLILKLPGIYGM